MANGAAGSGASYRAATREEIRKLGPVIGSGRAGVPGEGSYQAYYRSENRNYRSLEFRMPQEDADAMAKDTARLEELMDEACSLYVKAWRLAEARCRALAGDISAADAGSRLDYEFEQALVRARLLEVKSEMEGVVYGQYEKGLAAGNLPEEVAEPMAKALEAYRSVDLPLQEKSLGKAKGRVAELARLLRGYRPSAPEGIPDAVAECARAQQAAYQATLPMHGITSLRPFYDGTWAYRGKRVISMEEYMSAMRHDIAWAESGAGEADFSGAQAVPDCIRRSIETEYGA